MLTGSFRWLQRRLEWVPILRGLVPERPLPVQSVGNPPTNIAMIVLIVHGTFGSCSKWLKSDSKVMSAIRSLPNTSVHLFKWSGTNSTPHRMTAAYHLADKCKELQNGNLSGAPIVIVAHSHGGNLAAWCATLLTFDIKAALYVNTPFIHAVHPEKSSMWLATSLIIAAVFAAFVLSFILSTNIRDHFGLPSIIGLLPPLLVLICGSVAGLFARGALKETSNQLRPLSTGLRRIKHNVAVDVVGDEPSAAFGGVYFVRFLGVQLFTLFGIVFGVTMVVLYFIYPALYQYVKDHVSIYLAIGFSLPLLLASLAYGMVQAVLSLDTSVAVAQGPIGRAALHTVVASDRKGLMHHMDSQDVADKLKTILEELRTT